MVPAPLRAAAFDESNTEMIDAGHWKEFVDHGAPTRISALEALRRCVAEAGHHVVVARRIELVTEGVADRNADVQIYTCRLLGQLADDFPANVLEHHRDSEDVFGVKPRFQKAGKGKEGKVKRPRTSPSRCCAPCPWVLWATRFALRHWYHQQIGKLAMRFSSHL